jgi:pimeloyl-ACP methyl ester carboxylesterase
MTAQHPSRRLILAGSLSAALAAALPSPTLAAGSTERALKTANGRDVSFWSWTAKGRKRGTILFSHGAASAPRHYKQVLQRWADAGYEVHAPLHVDSTEHPRTAEFAGLASWSARIEDMRALSAMLGGAAYVAAGHSFGALTALALGGAVGLAPEGITGPLRDLKTQAIIALSPPAPMAVLVGEGGYNAPAVPLFLQTGTRDIPTGSTQADAWKGHLAPYEAAKEDGHHYALVLNEVTHYFGGLIGRPDAAGPPSSSALEQFQSLSSLFLAAATQSDGKARRKLQSLAVNDGTVGLHRK